MSARRLSWIAGLLVTAASFAGAQHPAYRVKNVPVGPGYGSDPSAFVGVSVVRSPCSSLRSSGSITVSTDDPYGALVGKAMALDPAGFAFDTPLSQRPR